MHPKDKLDVILKALGPVSEPDEDIRQVRARGKKRINLYPFRPYDIYIESYGERLYNKVFTNSVEPRTWLDETGRVSLTSYIRKIFLRG